MQPKLKSQRHQQQQHKPHERSGNPRQAKINLKKNKHSHSCGRAFGRACGRACERGDQKSTYQFGVDGDADAAWRGEVGCDHGRGEVSGRELPRHRRQQPGEAVARRVADRRVARHHHVVPVRASDRARGKNARKNEKKNGCTHPHVASARCIRMLHLHAHTYLVRSSRTTVRVTVSVAVPVPVTAADAMPNDSTSAPLSNRRSSITPPLAARSKQRAQQRRETQRERGSGRRRGRRNEVLRTACLCAKARLPACRCVSYRR
jgi:hypothetical protein